MIPYLGSKQSYKESRNEENRSQLGVNKPGSRAEIKLRPYNKPAEVSTQIETTLSTISYREGHPNINFA